MVKDTLTFELGGRVMLKEFEAGIAAFRRLVVALTPKNADVGWVVDDLQSGSAIATIRGRAENMSEVEQIVAEYEKIGYALAQREEPAGHSVNVRKAATAIRTLAGAVEYVRFETRDSDQIIYGNGEPRTGTGLSVSIGAITGRVQTLSNRSGLRFNLYDSVHDRAVACYLEPEREELMREAWGRLARVSGRVSREGTTGRPIAIRRILNVSVLQEAAQDSYLNARGAVPWEPGDIMPEDVIRRLRDA